MSNEIIRNRASGAIMGAFIGDALALGPHWYYDLDDLRQDYGDWIDYYSDPKPGRYHNGLKAGQLSQAGFILKLTLRSLVACRGYDAADFCRRMDEDLFPLLDGTPVSGPGKYTSQSIREAWRHRVQQNLPWGRQTGSHADTTEAIERTLAIAVRYALQPDRLASAIAENTILTQTDDTVVSMTVAFGAVLGILVQGHTLDTELSSKLMERVKSGELPFHAITRENLQPPQPGDPDPPPAHFARASYAPCRMISCNTVFRDYPHSRYPHRLPSCRVRSATARFTSMSRAMACWFTKGHCPVGLSWTPLITG